MHVYTHALTYVYLNYSMRTQIEWLVKMTQLWTNQLEIRSETNGWRKQRLFGITAAHRLGRRWILTWLIIGMSNYCILIM